MSRLRFLNCFKKSAPNPPDMEITAPIPRHYDYGNGIVPPYHRDYTVHTVASSVPVPPPKTYHTKYSSNPSKPARPPPNVFENYWEFGNEKHAGAVAELSEHQRPLPVHTGHPPSSLASTSRSGSLAPGGSGTGLPSNPACRKPANAGIKKVTHNEHGAKRSFLRNAALDEHGLLKDQYETVGDVDWETPEEYRSRAQRRAAKKRGQWSDNY